MSAILAGLLSTRFANQDEPPWVDPFLAATRRMDILEERERDGTQVTAETKAEKEAAKAAVMAEQAAALATSASNAKGSKKGRGKAKEKVVAEPVEEKEDGLGDEVEDVVMASAAEELLKTVSDFSYRTQGPDI